MYYHGIKIWIFLGLNELIIWSVVVISKGEVCIIFKCLKYLPKIVLFL